jgi:hypothetical protein
MMGIVPAAQPVGPEAGPSGPYFKGNGCASYRRASR